MVENPKYDVALSFLSEDQEIARTLYSQLIEVFDVFFYPEKQDAMAGTDGMESMRKAFVEETRLIVVLYREKWGQTPWTALEERAIQEVCFNREWHRLLVIVLDNTKLKPGWLSPTHICYNLNEFGVDQAVGAIKARVLDNSGRFKPMTPLKRAEQLKASNEYRQARREALSTQGEAGIKSKVAEVCSEIVKRCGDVNAAGHQEIQCGIHTQDLRECVMTDGRVSMTVYWQRESSPTELGHLVIVQFNDRLMLPTEARRTIHVRQPQRVGEKRYKPELSLSYELGWEDPDTKEFLSSKVLADKCVVAFMDLIERRNSGGMPRRKNLRII